MNVLVIILLIAAIIYGADKYYEAKLLREINKITEEDDEYGKKEK